jgi:hypothetical protein
MRLSLGIVLACAAGACVVGAAQPPAPSPTLAAARATYQRALDKAKAAHDDAVKRAATDFKRDLTSLLDVETKAGRLDAALAIRDEIRAADEGRKAGVSTKADLKKALTGSRWNWGEGMLVLQADGLARHPVWETSSLVTRWEAVDRRTAILTIERGRNTNKLAVLEFSEALDEIAGGVNFEGTPMAVKKRLPDKK